MVCIQTKIIHLYIKPNGSRLRYATVITIDCLSKMITFQSDYLSPSPQRFGFKMSFSILKSRSTAALEATARREILKEGRAH